MINTRQAIEFIAFQWEPYTSEDEEILAGRNRKLFFSDDLENKSFLIKQAGLKLGQYIKQGCLIFDAVIDEDKVNPVELEKSLKNGKISYTDYMGAFTRPLPSNVMLIRHCVENNYSKETIAKKSDWPENFDFIFCKDVLYYKDPYENRYLEHPESEYDLFYIKTNNGYDIRYLDLAFDFQSLRGACENHNKGLLLTSGNEKYLINPTTKAERMRKESETGISNTKNYRTPYLLLIDTMIEKGYLAGDEPPLAKALIEDIKKEATAANIKISDRMATSMATILRPPEAQKGGLKKIKG